ncbi:hypothetical protein ABFS82_09G059800 [Erythranthe guttata]|uniref:DUF4228 domain-containing protein n=1 Tax=Erythranthe guttata TaxID=4155 RepID=A0A022RK40_ERYGU|nr:hypothetical protein MIMGU_mgv1a021511mg [Erythranthe guttata]
MGNAALMCAPSIISNGGGGGVVRVVSTTDGRLLIYTTKSSPPKAAEILIRNPGEFLCESTHLRVGQRIPGVCADEELEIGQLYFLLPMEMLYSVLTDDEMNSIVNTHKTSTKLGFKQQAVIFSKKNITSITFPHDFFCLFPNNNNNNNNLEDESANGERFIRQRSWEPALETIHE